MGGPPRVCFDVKCGRARSKEEMANEGVGRMQKEHRKRIDPMFTPTIRRNMSPASCKFGQSGRAPQCRHGVPQTHTLKEMVGVGQAIQRLSPDSSLLPSEHAAAWLRIVRTVFCTPCFSGRGLAAKFRICRCFWACIPSRGNIFQLGIIPMWYYSNLT